MNQPPNPQTVSLEDLRITLGLFGFLAFIGTVVAGFFSAVYPHTWALPLAMSMAVILLGFIVLYVVTSRKAKQNDAALEQRRLNEAPWAVGRETLERYWSRNLGQNTLTFFLSATTIVIGFAILVFGIYTASTGGNLSTSILAGTGGVVSQFLGATLLVLHRSTVAQASAYTQSLDRMNSIEMAWYILNTMSEASERDRGVKDRARVEMLRAIVASSSFVSSATPETPERAGNEQDTKPPSDHMTATGGEAVR